MKKIIVVLLVIVIIFSISASYAFADNVRVHDDGKEGLKQWTVALYTKAMYEVEDLLESLNNYCIANKCTVVSISTTVFYDHLVVYAVVKK